MQNNRVIALFHIPCSVLLIKTIYSIYLLKQKEDNMCKFLYTLRLPLKYLRVITL